MKTRIISAIVALAIIIPLILLGGKPYIIGIGVLAILGYKEILDLKESHKPIPKIIQLIGMIDLLLLVFSEFDGYSIMFGITYKGIAITLLSMLIPVVIYKENNYTTKDALYMIGSILLLGTIFNLFILFRAISIYKLVYLILIATMTDTFAMVIGKLIGKHKLMADVSPNKTWEGSMAGSIMGSVVAIIFYNYFVLPVTVKVVLFTVFLSIIGQFGDLIFSKIKRENKIKDFSNVMPGHGGILDRLDSLSIIIITYAIIFGLF